MRRYCLPCIRHLVYLRVYIPRCIGKMYPSILSPDCEHTANSETVNDWPTFVVWGLRRNLQSQGPYKRQVYGKREQHKQPPLSSAVCPFFNARKTALAFVKIMSILIFGEFGSFCHNYQPKLKLISVLIHNLVK